MKMNNDINRIMKCLTLSVQENEITNLQSLSWAINKLENFPMTFDVLDQSRIGQTLQSVRHSKKISADISERIRYLIKCWRRLLDVNCQSIVPNEVRKMSFSSVKKPTEMMNGIIKNGFVKEKITSDIVKNCNGINHTNSLEIINKPAQISDENSDRLNEITQKESAIKENFDENQEKTAQELSKFNDHEENLENSHENQEKASEKLSNCNENQENSYENQGKTLENLDNFYENQEKSSEKLSKSNENQENFENSNENQENLNENMGKISENLLHFNENQETIQNQIDNDICNKIIPETNPEQNQIIDPIPKTAQIEVSCNSETNQENLAESNLNGASDENLALDSKSKSTNRIQLGKPKLKSTKELLADFSNLIDTDTKNKILLNKITQEDDDPVSYHPQEYKLREIIQQKNLFIDSSKKAPFEEEEEENDDDNKEEEEGVNKITDEINDEIDRVIERVVETKKETKCDKLLKKFQLICGIQPTLIVKPMVPWRNLKRGIDCSAPCIKQPKIKKITDDSSDPSKPKFSVADIDDLLQTFEIRAQRKDLITAAIQERKEIQIVDNTQSITDLSLKLTLKIPAQQKIKILKIKKRKKKKKKKKKKLKPKVKIVIKRPRKPVVKPKPPITNFMDDLPKLPELIMANVTETVDDDFSTSRQEFIYSDENVNQFTYDTVEGYNCTKHTQSSELMELTKMYSLLIDDTYFHVFPWVDLEYSAKSMFSSESDQIIQTALDLSQLSS